MTKFLSQALQAKEPDFRQGVDRLELSHGRPSHDIRLTTEVMRCTRDKINDLGLNGSDTTAEELYHSLMHKVAADDQKLVKRLRFDAAVSVSAEADVVEGMVLQLNRLDDHKTVFAIKPSCFKRLIKANPPKKALKMLGYRSVDSFIKRESIESILGSAWLVEGRNWRNQLMSSYKKLTPKDFESRDIIITNPKTKQWTGLAQKEVEARRNNLMSLKEIGAIIVLPLPKNSPSGTVTVSMALALHEMNMIRASSSYLKLCQVRRDFGKMVAKVAADEIELRGADLSQPTGWMLIQRYYHRVADEISAELFEPQLKPDDFNWQPIEKSLAKIEPSFNFWHESSHLGLMHEKNIVSMNLIDSAINYCNQLPFDKRFSEFFKQSLWHELLLGYLKRDKVERTVLNEIQPKLVAEEVTV